MTRARVTQVMDLLRLAPDVQEAVLGLSRGQAAVGERELGRIGSQIVWRTQRDGWARLRTKADNTP